MVRNRTHAHRCKHTPRSHNAIPMITKHADQCINLSGVVFDLALSASMERSESVRALARAAAEHEEGHLRTWR